MAVSKYGTASDFAANLKKYAEKKNIELHKLFVAVCLRAMENIVRRTPVGDPTLWQNPAPKGYIGGTARNSWFITNGAPADSVVENAADKEGSGALQAGAQAIAQTKLGGTVYINNTLPYIRRLEHGWSGQAPSGMVKVTVAEIEAFYRNEVKAGA